MVVKRIFLLSKNPHELSSYLGISFSTTMKYESDSAIFTFSLIEISHDLLPRRYLPFEQNKAARMTDNDIACKYC